MKNYFKLLSVCAFSSIGLFGCVQGNISRTPAVMTYDGSNVDYSKLHTLKKSTSCKNAGEADGNLTISSLTKKAKISKVIHIDTFNTYNIDNFNGKVTQKKECITIYGK
ncbi:MAG: hypothetical protein DRQ51_09820 [Gammaproteobacteria bacterium]|nr:MAG: hypothetical protein DRQ51_09820 [Gammaproteobacteria bacterium]